MSRRTMLLLATLAVALTSWVLVFERGAPAWEGAGRMFPDLEPGDVIRLRIERRLPEGDVVAGSDTRPIVLERRGEAEWWLVEPREFRGFLPRVQGLLWAIVDMVVVNEIPPESAALLSAFPGPDREQLSFRFETRSGKQHVVELGNPHPAIAEDLYARVDGRVFVTRAKIREAFAVSADDLRSRAICPIAEPDAVYFSVVTDGKAAKTLAREEGDRYWKFRSGDALEGMVADPARMQAILDGLSGWKALRFVDGFRGDASLLASSGLDGPRARVVVRHRRGDTVELDVGSTFEESGSRRVWLTWATGDTAFVADAEELDLVLTEAAALRTRYVFDLDGEEIDEVICRTPQEVFSLKRAGADGAATPARLDDLPWTVVSEDGETILSADRVLVSEALAESRQILVEEFLPQPEASGPGAEGAGWQGTVTFRLRSGREESLSIWGPSTEERDRDLDMFQATRSIDSARFLILSRWPRRLEEGAYFFADREISTLVPATCLEIHIETESERWVLGRPPGTYWSVAGESELQPEKRLDDERVERLLDALRRERFRVRSFEPRVDKSEWERLGVGNVRFRFRVDLDKFSTEHRGFRRLTVGFEDRDEDSGARFVWARADGVDPLLTLRPEIASQVESLIDHLRDVTASR